MLFIHRKKWYDLLVDVGLNRHKKLTGFNKKLSHDVLLSVAKERLEYMQDYPKKAECIKALATAITGRKRLAERLEMLGIPKEEMTPSVSLAVTALLEKLEDVQLELGQAQEHIAEMERLVDVDCLLPIANRRAFMRRLNWTITMFERYGDACSVLYFDINDFKHINDTYGHAAGDLAIRHIAQIISSSIRDSDFIARLGGDEFAVIMHHADETSARARAEKISDRIIHTPFMLGTKNISLSVACGTYMVRSGDNAETTLAAADTSMYVDKRRSKSQSLRA